MRKPVVAALLLGPLLGACGDDSLGRTFQPTNGNDNAPDENASPLSPGDYGFFASARFVPEVGAGAGGTDASLSASANLCARIDEVRDLASRGEASTASGSLRVTGGSAVELSYQDTVNPTLSRTLVDASLSPLWIKRVLYPNGQPVSPAAIRRFILEQGPRPDDDDASFLFVEVRTLARWAGFDDVSGDTFQWFVGPPLSLEGNDFFDDLLFDSRPPPPSSSNTLTVSWRELGDPSYPAELQGPLVHTIRFEFDAAGVVRNVREVVVPDNDPTVELDASTAQVVCIDSEPCLQGFLQDDNFDQLFCAF